MVSDHIKNSGAVGATTKFNALRLIKGRNLKAPYYYSVLTFKPDHFAGEKYVSDEALLSAYTPLEVAAIFSTIYLFKKAKKLSDPDEWGFLAPAITQGCEVGPAIGLAIPKVGVSAALFSWTLRYLAVASFLRHSKKHFQEFRRNLKDSSLLDLNAQLHSWGCTDLQIASIFLQSFGYGVEYSSSLVMGLSNEGPLDKTLMTTSPFKVAEIWIKSMSSDAKIPPIVHDASYHPSAENAKRLCDFSRLFIENGPIHNWITKGTEDISPEATPQLFREGAKTEVTQDPPQISAEAESELAALEQDLNS